MSGQNRVRKTSARTPSCVKKSVPSRAVNRSEVDVNLHAFIESARIVKILGREDCAGADLVFADDRIFVLIEENIASVGETEI